MELFLNLTINGLATGMLIFFLAAGLTLIFGLMDVLNFAHGGTYLHGELIVEFGFTSNRKFYYWNYLAPFYGIYSRVNY